MKKHLIIGIVSLTITIGIGTVASASAQDDYTGTESQKQPVYGESYDNVITNDSNSQNEYYDTCCDEENNSL